MIFTEQQKQVFIGSMLGDAYLTLCKPPGGTPNFAKTQSRLDHHGQDKLSYLTWHEEMFSDFGAVVSAHDAKANGIVRRLCGDKIYQNYVFRTKHSKFWQDLERQWYVPREHRWFKRRKVIPSDITLTPLSLCVWHMDDGTNNPVDANIELCTNGFTVDEVEFLIYRLKNDLDITSHKKTANNQQYKIYVGRKSYFDFIDMIKPHIEWDCFHYKINTSRYVKTTNQGHNHGMSKLTEDQIMAIFDMRKQGASHKDIAKHFHISGGAVSLILTGLRWPHLGLGQPGIKKPRIMTSTKEEIIRLYYQGMLQYDIAERVGVNQASVSRTIQKHTMGHK